MRMGLKEEFAEIVCNWTTAELERALLTLTTKRDVIVKELERRAKDRETFHKIWTSRKIE